jgi:hypothetical protein
MQMNGAYCIHRTAQRRDARDHYSTGDETMNQPHPFIGHRSDRLDIDTSDVPPSSARVFIVRPASPEALRLAQDIARRHGVRLDIGKTCSFAGDAGAIYRAAIALRQAGPQAVTIPDGHAERSAWVLAALKARR